MAATTSMASHLIIFLTFLISFATIQASSRSEDQSDFVTTEDLEGMQSTTGAAHDKQEKLRHFRVYWHDIANGSKPTAIGIVQAPTNNSTGFGAMVMIDDPLTLGPDLSSKLVGRAQGFYALSSQQESSLLMAMNFVFLQGKYNGSSITILGRNPVFHKAREMPVIEASALFRFARGYVHVTTYSFDLKSGDAVVEYNIYVLHY